MTDEELAKLCKLDDEIKAQQCLKKRLLDDLSSHPWDDEIWERLESWLKASAADEGDGYDFTDPNQNPWILSHQEADQLLALRQ